MFDPPGSDSPNEFVEIFNASRNDTVDLSQWKVADTFSEDDLTDAGMGTKLAPQSFAVILEGDYPIGSGLYDSLIPDTVLVVKVDDSAIGNQLSTSDSVALIDGEGNRVDSHGWENVSAPGFSLERIRNDRPSTQENWALSTAYLGTPGTPNSATPPGIDGSIDSAAITHFPLYPDPTQSVFLTVTVTNRGLEMIHGHLWVTENHETLGDRPFENLPAGDSLNLTLTLLPLNPGIHNLLLELEVRDDANPENDTARHPITIQFPVRAVTVNEILVEPQAGAPEFFELVNLTSQDVDLAGWSFTDSDTSIPRFFASGTLPAGGYGVVAADSSLLSLVAIASPLIVPENGFSALNNSGDTLHLFDPSGTLVDRVPYSSDWNLVRGRSLEKIRPNLIPEERQNWGPSVAREGMTPGSKNSLFVEVLPSSGAITLEPNPFSPDGDRVDDEIKILYTLPYSQASMTAQVFDSRGRSIRTVARNLAVASEGTLTWNGRDDRGRRSRIGLYVLKVVAIDRDTRKSLEWVKTVILAGALR